MPACSGMAHWDPAQPVGLLECCRLAGASPHMHESIGLLMLCSSLKERPAKRQELVCWTLRHNLAGHIMAPLL